MTNLEQEAETAKMMVEADGRRAFVLIASIDGDHTTMTRSISDGTTKRDAISWIGALNRERERIAALIGIDPDSIETESL